MLPDGVLSKGENLSRQYGETHAHATQRGNITVVCCGYWTDEKTDNKDRTDCECVGLFLSVCVCVCVFVCVCVRERERERERAASAWIGLCTAALSFPSGWLSADL